MRSGSRIDRKAVLTSLQTQLDGVREAIDEGEDVIKTAKVLLREAYAAVYGADDSLSLEIEEIVHDLLALLREEDRQQLSDNAELVDHQFKTVD